MVKYECDLARRPRVGSISNCNDCITSDCTNPIYNVIVNVGEIKRKERL